MHMYRSVNERSEENVSLLGIEGSHSPPIMTHEWTAGYTLVISGMSEESQE